MNKKSFLIFLLLLIISILLIVKSFSYKYIDYNKYTNANTNANSKCNIKTCGALDPVSNPAYNMQQIVKQSILLEEHITNKNKRCRDCITKHFLHIIGLAEEAQMLATNDPNKYPLINESVELYNSLFKEWLKIKDDEKMVLSISDKLRIHRKKLIAIYFFNDSYDVDNFSKSSMG